MDLKYNNMKISIITVCRNVQDTIEKTINSVISQTYNNIEYIIVDGKSTDKTIEIIETHRDKINTFISEKDSGIYDAMNKGINLATGDVLFFLNSGDTLYDPNVIEKVANAFTSSGADLIYGDVSIIDELKHQIFTQDQSKTSRVSLIGQNICHQSIFATRKVFDLTGPFNTEYKIYADYEWLLKALFELSVNSKHMDTIISNYILTDIFLLPNSQKILEQHHKERTQILDDFYFGFEVSLFRFLNRYFKTLTRVKFINKGLVGLYSYSGSFKKRKLDKTTHLAQNGL